MNDFEVRSLFLVAPVSGVHSFTVGGNGVTGILNSIESTDWCVTQQFYEKHEESGEMRLIFTKKTVIPEHNIAGIEYVKQHRD